MTVSSPVVLLSLLKIPGAICSPSFYFYFFKILLLIYLFYLFIHFWLRRVLVVARGIFVEACGIFPCGTPALHCGAKDFSLVVVRGFSLL